MTCSTCNNESIIVLIGRAFCGQCYSELLQKQRKCIEDMPLKPGATEEAGPDAGE